MAMPRVVLLMLLLNTAVVIGSVVTNYLLLKPVLNGGAVAAAPVAAGGAQAGEAAMSEVAAGAAAAVEPEEYAFFPVQKVIVSLSDDSADEPRERYFVLDLVLQATLGTDKKKLEQADPMVRSSAVAYLSAQKYPELRGTSIPDLQGKLESALLTDFAARGVLAPFQHVLISKMLVQ